MNARLKVIEKIVQTTSGKRLLRYLTSIDYLPKLGKEEVAEMIQKQEGIPAYQILGVLEAVGRLLAKHVSEGEIVEIPYIGNFRLIVKCKSADDPKKAGMASVQSVKVHYHPAKNIREAIEPPP